MFFSAVSLSLFFSLFCQCNCLSLSLNCSLAASSKKNRNVFLSSLATKTMSRTPWWLIILFGTFVHLSWFVWDCALSLSLSFGHTYSILIHLPFTFLLSLIVLFAVCFQRSNYTFYAYNIWLNPYTFLLALTTSCWFPIHCENISAFSRIRAVLDASNSFRWLALADWLRLIVLTELLTLLHIAHLSCSSFHLFLYDKWNSSGYQCRCFRLHEIRARARNKRETRVNLANEGTPEKKYRYIYIST